MTLKDALTKAARIIEKRATIPILANVLIEPETNGIAVTATNLEMRYQASVEGLTIPEPFTVNCELLLKILKNVKDIQRFEYDKDKKKLYVGNVELDTLPVSEFPVTETEMDLDEYIDVPLKRLEHLKRAMSKDETRYTMNGIFIDTEKGNLVATDGHRLHLTPNVTVPAAPVIIPKVAVEFLDKTKAESIWIPKKKECDCDDGCKKWEQLTQEGRERYTHDWLEDAFFDMKDAPEVMFDELTEEQLEVVRKSAKEPVETFYLRHKVRCVKCQTKILLLWFADNEILTVRPIDGTFPDYNQVILASFKHHYYINSDELKQTLKECISITGKKNPVVVMNGNTVTARNPDTLNKIDTQLSGKGTFPETGIGFNPNYLIDAITGDGVITIETNSHKEPARITMKGDDVISIVMPVDINIPKKEETTETEAVAE